MKTLPASRLLPRRLLSLLCIAGAALAGGPAAAAEVRGGERVHITSDASVPEDLYTAAREVIIDGVIRGDLVAAGSRVTIRGRVEGSVIAAGGAVRLDGTVGRAARLAGRDVQVNGFVGTDVVAACGTCLFAAASRAGADLLTAGSKITAAGAVARRFWAAGDRVRLSGQSGGEAEVRAGSLWVEPTASAPALVYGSRQPAHIDTAARIGRVESRPAWAPQQLSRLGGAVLTFLMALLTGAVLLRLLPGGAASARQHLRSRPGPALLCGALGALLGPPLVALGLATVVAAPLALLAAAGLFFGLYAGYLLSAALLGELLLKVAQRPASPFATFALGLLTLGLVDLVPLLGPIATVAATLAGFGGLLLLARVPREAR